jgi:DNA-binding LacI/PurR family transcriptional regulator
LAHIQAEGLTALVCDSDTTFEDSLRILADAGFRVPEDVSVLCLTTPNSSYPLMIQPTYVRLNRIRLGEIAVQILNRRITSTADGVEHIYIPCELSVGETTAAPNSR